LCRASLFSLNPNPKCDSVAGEPVTYLEAAEENRKALSEARKAETAAADAAAKVGGCTS
jgi:hypothetical protein